MRIRSNIKPFFRAFIVFVSYNVTHLFPLAHHCSRAVRWLRVAHQVAHRRGQCSACGTRRAGRHHFENARGSSPIQHSRHQLQGILFTILKLLLFKYRYFSISYTFRLNVLYLLLV